MTQQPTYGPHNPHPLSQMRTELVWEGKYDEYGQRREVDIAGCAMPMQRIEGIDEPRREAMATQQLGLFEQQNTRRDDFRNRLIWGDNKLVMASLLQEFKGKVDLIYIDPPFDVGADFTLQVQIGDEEEAIAKDQSTLEMVAYRDMWGKGVDSYLYMLYERLILIKELLSDQGSLYVHCDWRMNSFLRALLDEVFAPENHRSEILWKRKDSNKAGLLATVTDTIYYYSKSDSPLWNQIYLSYSDERIKKAYNNFDTDGRQFALSDLMAPGDRKGTKAHYEWNGVLPRTGRHWAYTREKIEELEAQGKIFWNSNGIPKLKIYLDEAKGTPLNNLWTDIAMVKGGNEALDYATQKPEALLDRIIQASSNEGDLVADFFCLAPGSLVLTKQGWKPIQELQIGDLVLTHTGKFEPILRVYERPYSGKILKIDPRKLTGALITPNHPILAIRTTRCDYDSNIICRPDCRFHNKGKYLNCAKHHQSYKLEWIPAEELREKDLVCIPKCCDLQRESAKDAILGVNRFKSNHFNANNQPEKHYIQASGLFYRLIGYYLAEGFRDKRSVKFSIHEDETAFAEDIKYLMEKVFQINHSSIKTFKNSKGINVEFHSTFLYNFFEQFGENALTKSIPEKYLHAPDYHLKQLVCGFIRGDGSGDLERTTLTTCSPKLAGQLLTIGYRVGIPFGFSKYLPRGTNNLAYSLNVYGMEAQKLRRLSHIVSRGATAKYLERKQTPRFIETEDYYLVPIDSISSQDYEGMVYNCEVANANSYMTEMGIVHNCGSGTTGAVAERLGRRWLMADLGRFAIHTSRKRMIELQRKLHSESKPYRAFDVYNLGRYERQWWQQERLQGADTEHRRVILEFFKAEVLTSTPSPLLHGRKAGAFCHVDGIDSLFTREEAKLVAQATAQAGGRECYCLAWEFEMDLHLLVNALVQELGVKLKLIQIPREIMEKNRKAPPPFLEVAVLAAEAVYRKGDKGKTVDLKLTQFLPSLAEVPTKELEAIRDRAIRSGFDFIDFWAIDFHWQPGKPFTHDRQDYRTRKDRSLKTISDAAYEYPAPGKYVACVKVVDTFGCDTSITIEVEV